MCKSMHSKNEILSYFVNNKIGYVILQSSAEECAQNGLR